MALTFKVARMQAEFEQIHELNYRTFVEEIPQHPGNPSRRLVDAFHDENTYVICLDRERVVGMVALRGKRPFSLDRKLDDLDRYLPPGRSLCEFRLLAVEKDYRSGPVFFGLARHSAEHAIRDGYDTAVISGTTLQLDLYRHLGFVPFGPLVGKPGALYQPMYGTLEALRERAARVLSRGRRTRVRNFLPGPVQVTANVQRAFGLPPVSHRSQAFFDGFNLLRKELCALAGAAHVEILLGSGTLANDATAAQLSLMEGPGLVLANGEFGERLADHARRFGLTHEVLRTAWGGAFSPAEVREALTRKPGRRWLWAVHCETSTGVLNDLDALREICREAEARLCLDCISSLGTVPLDLRGVHLASGTSGKGLGSYPGLSFVYSAERVAPAPDRLPRYLDLGAYSAAGGVPYTTSSNLVAALQAAVVRFRNPGRIEAVRALGVRLRSRLRAAGFTLVAPEEHAAPAVTSIALPSSACSAAIGERLEGDGFLLSYRSDYLLQRNWIQIALMGDVGEESLDDAVAALRELCAARPEGLRDQRLAAGAQSDRSRASAED